jgi:hypothetical protein
MRYQVVTAKALVSETLGILNFPSMTRNDGLLDKVRIMIEEGWAPQGGVSHTDALFAQAMVKECEDNSEPDPEPEPEPKPKPNPYD